MSLITNPVTVGFTGLKIESSIGILPLERAQSQEIVISLKIVFYPDGPIQDEISSTIDYSTLSQICQEMAFSKHRALLETLAFEILDALLDRFPASYGWIRIEKPAAIAAALCGFVEYERGIKR
jgi:dihydroneopterin aldolase